MASSPPFGITAVFISGCTVAWDEPASPVDLSWTVWGAVLFIGLGTASVFLLRCRSLQSLTPATVGAYHNLIPICTIAIAHLSLGEPVTAQTMTGALAVLLGTELVRRKPEWSALYAHKIFLGRALAPVRSTCTWGALRKAEADTHRFRPSKGGYI